MMSITFSLNVCIITDSLNCCAPFHRGLCVLFFFLFFIFCQNKPRKKDKEIYFIFYSFFIPFLEKKLLKKRRIVKRFVLHTGRISIILEGFYYTVYKIWLNYLLCNVSKLLSGREGRRSVSPQVNLFSSPLLPLILYNKKVSTSLNRSRYFRECRPEKIKMDWSRVSPYNNLLNEKKKNPSINDQQVFFVFFVSLRTRVINWFSYNIKTHACLSSSFFFIINWLSIDKTETRVFLFFSNW